MVPFQIVNSFATVCCSFHSDKKKLLKQVGEIVTICDQNTGLIEAFDDHTVNKQELLQALFEPFDFTEEFKDTFNLFCDYKMERFGFVLLKEIHNMLLDLLAIKTVLIFSHEALSKQQSNRLEKYITSTIKETCDFQYLVDEKLIIGIKIQIDECIQEFSVKNEMHKLKTELQLV